jgi:hypothetical protein
MPTSAAGVVAAAVRKRRAGSDAGALAASTTTLDRTRMERRPLHVLQARPRMMVQSRAQVVDWQECLGLARGLTQMRLGPRPL